MNTATEQLFARIDLDEHREQRQEREHLWIAIHLLGAALGIVTPYLVAMTEPTEELQQASAAIGTVMALCGRYSDAARAANADHLRAPGLSLPLAANRHRKRALRT